MNSDGATPQVLATDLPCSLNSGDRTPRLSWPLRLLMYMLSGLKVGTLEVRLPNGMHKRLSGELPGEQGSITIHNERFVRHLLRGGEVGIGDAYIDGCWDSPDLTRLLLNLYANEPHYRGPFEKNIVGRLYGWWQHRRRANTKRKARENIQRHYDLGNDFYTLWLDETMAYSSALFAHPEQTLYDAQLNKFRALYERLDLKPEHHLLEIGSGWGGFAIYAAQRSGCRVHSITLSEEQLAFAKTAAHEAGVADRVRFELRDYRDISQQYDRVVSVEMYEAVGEEFWPTYFATLERALKPSGQAVIQGITINPAIFDSYRIKRDFIQKYIFPGGMLCPPQHFETLARDAGLAPVKPTFHALDYAETLARWHTKVIEMQEAIVGQFDERFFRMWRYYLSYCETGFRTGSIDLMQITLQKTAG